MSKPKWYHFSSSLSEDGGIGENRLAVYHDEHGAGEHKN
jgi:hypothetical protein